MSEQPPYPAPSFEPLPPPRGAGNRLVLVLVAAAVVLGLVAVGAVVALTGDDEGAVPGLGSAAATCGEVVSKPIGRAALHADPPGKVDYPDSPPAFGDHWPAPAPFGRPFYTADRPAVEELVHNLEHGYTIAWYDEAVAADEAAMDALRQIAVAYQQDGERFIAAPWLSSDGPAFPDDTHVALTRWSADAADPGDVSQQLGNWIYCGTVVPDAIEQFFDTWPNGESAEPGLY